VTGKRRRAHRVADHPGPAAPSVYLESSAVVASLIEGDASAMRTIRQAHAVASALTFAEVRRTLLRASLAGRLSTEEIAMATTELDRIESTCVVLPIDDVVLARAGRHFPAEPVRTLDAIHLASAELVDDPHARVTLLTRDARIRENAILLGLRVA
jgi:uncharacterized protein